MPGKPPSYKSVTVFRIRSLAPILGVSLSFCVGGLFLRLRKSMARYHSRIFPNSYMCSVQCRPE